jgi:hypothetical protein
LIQRPPRYYKRRNQFKGQAIFFKPLSGSWLPPFADARRAKITYAGAEGKRAIAYPHLPKRYPPPWQVIQ